MRENLEVFDFELTGGELGRIAALDTGKTLFFDHSDPAIAVSSRTVASRNEL